MIKNLKKLRREFNVSQQRLAEVILVSQQSVNKYENKDVEPDIDTLIKIAEFFDVSLDYLAGRTEVREMADKMRMSDLDSAEARLIRGYRSLTDKQKKCISELVENYK